MKMKKLLACLLAISAVVSAAGCNFGKGDASSSESVNSEQQDSTTTVGGIPEATNPQEDFQAHYVEGTLHDVNVDYNSPANLNFIKDGQSDYKIVLGSSLANESVAYVNKYFARGAGCMLEKVEAKTEEEQEALDVSENSTYVMFGCTYAFEQAGFVMPEFEQIGGAGYYIVTYGKNVFVQAYGEQGYQLGGICLLRQTLGFDIISSTTTIYERDGSILPRMEITERPDFDYRQQDNQLLEHDISYGMGFTTTEMFLSTGTSWMHNIVDFLGGDVSKGSNDGTSVEHPKWFSNDTNKTQGCFTAHGDKEEYALMVQNYIDKTIEFMKKKPTVENIVLGQMDVISNDRVSRCTCASCNAAFTYYGDTNAGSHLALVNNVARGVAAWLETEEAQEYFIEVTGAEKKTMNVLVLVYGSSINPPVQRTEGGAVLFDENGKGVPKQQKWFNVDDEGNVTEEDVLDEDGNPVYLVCEPNADLFYCASSANYLHSFYEAENTSYSNMVKGWSGLGGNFCVWTYEVNYYNYMYPYNSYDSMLENMRYFKNEGANHFFYQGLWENKNNAGFDKLRSYINSKGMFNVNVSYEEVVAKFFKYQFDEAGDLMREYFNQVVQQLRANESYTGGSVHSNDLTKPVVWPEGLIRTWYNMTQEAYKLVEHKKTADPERYEQLWINITAESLFPRWVLCTTYANSSSFTNEALKTMRREFMEDFEKLANTSHQEHHTISEVFSTWDV